MAHFTLRALSRVIVVSFGSVSLAVIGINAVFQALRPDSCRGSGCEVAESLGGSPELKNPNFPAEPCVVDSLILQHSASHAIRDKILLVGGQSSIGEYILPLMHLSKYDASLSDPSFSRQGLSAVKYGHPIYIPSSKIRHLLFQLGLADAIVISPQKISNSIKPADIKFRFRLQPFILRVQLPPISSRTGISEDSEVVQDYITRNPNLFSRTSYQCL